MQRRAIPIWLIVGLLIWATFHLIFLSQDFAAQFLEFERIWKYVCIGTIFAFGLGLSLVSADSKASASDASKPDACTNKALQSPYWILILLGLSAPLMIYLLKYALTTYGSSWGIRVPTYLQIYFIAQPFYIPKTDYVAFCLPALAIALGRIEILLSSREKLKHQFWKIFFYMTLIVGNLFLFDIQNIKNGIAYSTVMGALFLTDLFTKITLGKWWKKWALAMLVLVFFVVVLYIHLQKNNSWRALVADGKVAVQTEKYQQWKFAGEQGYPINEYGQIVSATNYERVAWFVVGMQLATQTPLGYGLVEDSFKRIAKANWPETSSNLSHSHSGWLDLFLAVGIPGVILVLGSLLLSMSQLKQVQEPWKSMVFWALFANGILWITTEVSAAITFTALIFWVSWAAGLTLLTIDDKIKSFD
ncbi:O-antigen ligase family protein [Polynucleobacter tropicus]|uniref:O-antigen ligase family protein n=1 Tax=Polynucleobacter tropicus TaxID=1743174 RepID=UPI001C2DD7C1|nr:O-antigen ligase family protein [Polynucleobacter tropicus]